MHGHSFRDAIPLPPHHILAASPKLLRQAHQPSLAIRMEIGRVHVVLYGCESFPELLWALLDVRANKAGVEQASDMGDDCLV